MRIGLSNGRFPSLDCGYDSYEKSQLGLPHIFDEPMTKMYYEAAKLSDEYNRTSYDDVEKVPLLLSQLLKHVGENTRIMPNFHCEYGHNITIGNNVFINFNSIVMACVLQILFASYLILIVQSIIRYKNLEAFQSVHHVSSILCYTMLYDFFALVFAHIRVRKPAWDNITQGKV